MCKEMRNIRFYMLYNIFLAGTMGKEKWYHGQRKINLDNSNHHVKTLA